VIGNYPHVTKDRCFHERQGTWCALWQRLPTSLLQHWATPEMRKMIDTPTGGFYTDADGVHWRRVTGSGVYERYTKPRDGGHTHDDMHRSVLAARICHLSAQASE